MDDCTELVAYAYKQRGGGCVVAVWHRPAAPIVLDIRSLPVDDSGAINAVGLDKAAAATNKTTPTVAKKLSTDSSTSNGKCEDDVDGVDTIFLFVVRRKHTVDSLLWLEKLKRADKAQVLHVRNALAGKEGLCAYTLSKDIASGLNTVAGEIDFDEPTN